MISTIIFDLAEVQIIGLLGIGERLKPVLGIPANEAYRGMRGEDLIDFFNGKMSEDEYWSRTIKKNHWKTDIPTLKRKVRENFVEIEGTREIIEKLKARGFKLGLLSQHAKEWVDYKEKKFGYHRLFHSVMYSFEVGVSKPDKMAYKLILDKLDSKPDECLFIDDRDKNLVPAKELGIHTILFKNPEQLKEDLTDLGISIDDE